MTAMTDRQRLIDAITASRPAGYEPTEWLRGLPDHDLVQFARECGVDTTNLEGKPR